MKHSDNIWHKLFHWELKLFHQDGETSSVFSLKRGFFSSFIALVLAFLLGIGCSHLFEKPNITSQNEDGATVSETETINSETTAELSPNKSDVAQLAPSEPINATNFPNVEGTQKSTVSQTSILSKKEPVMIAELLETLPTLEGTTFLERYAEFEENGYNLPSGKYYLNDDFTSPAMEDDYLRSSGNLFFDFTESHRTCIALHRNTSKAFDFNCEFILFEHIVYREGDNIIVEGIDNAISNPRIYRSFELHSDGTYTYRGEHLKNADISDSSQKILQANPDGTIVLDKNELALYYLGSKKCFVSLPEGEIVPFFPNVYGECFYEAPFIIDGKLMCIQSYLDTNDEPKMVLHTLATNVEKVCKTYYVDKLNYSNSYDAWLLQYVDGSYGLLRFCNSTYQSLFRSPAYDDYKTKTDFSSYYLGCDFNIIEDYSLVSSNIAEITKFEPEKQVYFLHFEPKWRCYSEFECWYLYLELNKDGSQYLKFTLPDFYYSSKQLQLPYDDANAAFALYTAPFSLQEYDTKIAELTALMDTWQLLKLS